ncbi:MAG: NUDIX hydrolase [Eubacterium sp.]|nr:NUDIX hydrolase [Eubacterium sp.]
MEEKWLSWAKQLQAIAQAGLAYSKDKYDRERFEQIRSLSVEIMAHYTEAGEEKIRDLFCGETGYQTPKVDVRAAIFKDDEILLVKESIDGRWSMPGGWADIGLSIKENIAKEAFEEAGLRVVPRQLVGIYDWVKNTEKPNPFAIYKAVMVCDVEGGAFTPNIETEDAGYFALDKLPPLSSGRTTEALIRQCLTVFKNPEIPPIVD